MRDSCPSDPTKAYRGLRVLVTGGTGFLGKSLVDRLLLLGCTVFVGVRENKKRDLFYLGEKPGVLHQFQYDLASPIEIDPDLFDSTLDLVFHLAAAGVHPNQSANLVTMRDNLLGASGLMEFSRACSVKRIVCAGSCFEYGSGERIGENSKLAPKTTYAKSKILCRELFDWFGQSYDIEMVYLRPFTIYGPGEARHRLISYVTESLMRNRPLSLTDGKQVRDFIFVEDVRDAFLAAGIHLKAEGGVFNVCTGQGYSVMSIAKMICGLLGSDMGLLKFGGLSRREADTDVLVGDPAHIWETLGWQSSVQIEDGIQRTLETLLEDGFVKA
jgi:nucleoside-diphosphate-sugar epimerase